MEFVIFAGLALKILGKFTDSTAGLINIFVNYAKCDRKGFPVPLLYLSSLRYKRLPELLIEYVFCVDGAEVMFL